MSSPVPAPGLDRETTLELAGRLDEARRSRTPTTRLTDYHPELTEADAYAIADHGVVLREVCGERVVGAKLGFTSAAMRLAMGVDSPNYGWLTDPMIVSDGRVSARRADPSEGRTGDRLRAPVRIWRAAQCRPRTSCPRPPT